MINVKQHTNHNIRPAASGRGSFAGPGEKGHRPEQRGQASPGRLYVQEAKRFIKAAIRDRQRLINLGVSRKNTSHMLKIIDRLTRYLKFYNYETPIKISKFIINNQADIYALIPGNAKEKHNKFNELLYKANQIVNQKHVS